METSSFARRVADQLAASRALLASAPRCELTLPARALLALAGVASPAPRSQRGHAGLQLLIVLALACAIGVGVGYAVHSVGAELTSALAMGKR